MLFPTARVLSVGFAIVAAVGCFVRDAGAGGFVRIPTFDAAPTCGALSLCTSDGDCSTGAICRDFGGAGTYCATTGQDLFCCSSGATCPSVRGAATTCVPVATASGTIELCLSPVIMFCGANASAAPTWPEIETCYRDASSRTAYVYEWARGDCDGDGVANGVDAMPCVPDVDAGAPDAGPPDGSAVFDASAVDGAAVDAMVGADVLDVVSRDAGADVVDGVDAGARSYRFRGGGGCRIVPLRANGGGRAGWLVVACALAFVTRRRRVA